MDYVFFAGQILEVGGFNPFEKSARQIGPSPQGSGENQKNETATLVFFLCSRYILSKKWKQQLIQRRETTTARPNVSIFLVNYPHHK